MERLHCINICLCLCLFIRLFVYLFTSQLLKLLEYISYNEGNRDCKKQTTIDNPSTSSQPSTNNNNTTNQNGTLTNQTDFTTVENSEEWDDYMPSGYIPGPEIPVTDADEWDDFLDEFGKPIESPTDEYGYDQYIVGHDLLSPSVARDYEQFSSDQFSEHKH